MNANKVSYCCNYIEKRAEEDNFEKGCVGKSITVMCQKCDISAPTLKELIEKLSKEFFVDMSYPFIDSEPVNFIGCNQLETADGNVPSKQESERWKKGEAKLYLCNYTFHVERRLTSPIEFGEFTSLGIQIE